MLAEEAKTLKKDEKIVIVSHYTVLKIITATSYKANG